MPAPLRRGSHHLSLVMLKASTSVPHCRAHRVSAFEAIFGFTCVRLALTKT